MISILINSMTSGGAERIVLTLSNRFVGYGASVSLLLIEKEQFYEIPQTVPAYYLSSRHSLDKSIWQLPYLLIGAWRLKRFVRKNKIPVVQSHLPRANCTNVLARLLGSPHQAQLVIHSMDKFDSRNRIYQFFARKLMAFILKRADSLIFISEVMRRELNDYYQLGNPDRQKVIYNPHILPEIVEKAGQPATAFAFDPAKQYLIYTGRLIRNKRINDLIEAFHIVGSKLSRLELLIIGEGEDEPDLRSQVKELKLRDRVHFLGYQDNPYPYIAGADLLVLPSEREGLPNILIESMACGTPVISSDCQSGPREILSPHSDLNLLLEDEVEFAPYGVLYPVKKVDLLARSILKLLVDKDCHRHYAEAGKRRAFDFDSSEISKTYMTVMEEMMSKKTAK